MDKSFIYRSYQSDSRYDIGKLVNLLMQYQAENISIENQYGWSNQPPVVTFSEPRNFHRAPFARTVERELEFSPIIKDMDWKNGDSFDRYFARAVRYSDPENPDHGYEQMHEPLSDEQLNAVVMWTVYEYAEPDEDGARLNFAIADFYGDDDADDAKAFAKMKNQST